MTLPLGVFPSNNDDENEIIITNKYKNQRITSNSFSHGAKGPLKMHNGPSICKIELCSASNM